MFGWLTNLFFSCFNCEKLRKVITDREAEIRSLQIRCHELEARNQVIRAEMHDIRNEANALYTRMKLYEAQKIRQDQSSNGVTRDAGR